MFAYQCAAVVIDAARRVLWTGRGQGCAHGGVEDACRGGEIDAFPAQSSLEIIKLHGDLCDPASLVISAGDYYNYFAKNPAVADLLKVELQTHTILFLGYGFSDPDLGMTIESAAAQSGTARPLLYTLQCSPTGLAVRAFARRGMKVIDIKTKSSTPKAYAKIEQWPDCFQRALRKYEWRKHSLQLTAPQILNGQTR